jgi:MoxR-like ATPase
MRLKMGYPSAGEGKEILQRFRNADPTASLETIAMGGAITEAQSSVTCVKVSEAVEQYIVDIIESTRHEEKILLGVSPRGSIALMRASQVLAVLENRNYVLPDDVKQVSVPVLSHRLIMKGHAISDSTGNAENVIRELLKKVPVPTEEI